MKWLAFALAMTMGAGAEAAPLSPVTDGNLNGIPLAQALATLTVLGEWRLPQGGWVRLMTARSEHSQDCQSGDTDASDCRVGPLLVSVYEAPTVPMDFKLFSGPEKLEWQVPKNEPRGKDTQGNFTLRLLGCEAIPIKTSDGTDYRLVADTYQLHVGETVTLGHFAFDASLEQLGLPQQECKR